MSHARIMCFSAVLVAATMLTSATNAYTIGRCTNGAEKAIDQLQIDREKISKVITDTQTSGVETPYVTGYFLWLKSETCKGSLVLDLREDCSFIDTFTRGDCSLADFRK